MRLAEYLDRTGESQSAFARRAGLTQANVSRIVLGGGAGLETAEKIIESTAGMVKLEDLRPMPKEEPEAEEASRAAG